MYSYAYTILTIAFFIIWVITFIFSPRSRPAIFWTSSILCFAGPVAELWLIPNYWDPVYLFPIFIKKWQFGAVDIVISFAAAGISAGVFEQVALRKGFPPLPRVTPKILLRLFGLASLGFFLMVILASVANLIYIYALLLSVAIPALLMLHNRLKILQLIIPIATIVSLLYWLFCVSLFIPWFPGVIKALWNLDNTLGVMLVGVPIEEMLWAFTTVLFAGPVYRVCCSGFRKERDRRYD